MCSRRGASHRRRGQPCQDSTLQQTFSLPGGLPLTLLAVADGHGAPAHHLSDVGSALACEAAAAVVAAALASLPAGAAVPGEGQLRALRRWLAEDLPRALQQRWLAAVRRHWLEGPGRGEGADVPFSPLPYGSTLGLLLLTPRWWALAGLGDWDLVRVDQEGTADLLSQEWAGPGASEATASLCQGGAGLVLGFRSSAWPLEERGEPFSLVLCTDGIRKSCASDGDFLALAAWLAAGVDDVLVEALDRISAEGCGDDVSVAIGRWPGGPEAPHSGPGPESEPVYRLQPEPEPAPHPHPDPDPDPDPEIVLQPESQAAVLPQPDSEPQPGLGFARQPQPRPGCRSQLPPAPRWPLRGMALLLTGALALLFAMAVGRRLPLTWGLTGSRLVPRPGWLPAGREPLRREVARLCLEPTLVVSSLHTRQSQVLGLRQGTLRPELLMQERDRDPLGALIAASYLERQHDPGHQNGLTSLRLCPALRSALENLWLPAGRPLIRAGTTAMTRRSSP